jgi:hypothetical protein
MGGHPIAFAKVRPPSRRESFADDRFAPHVGRRAKLCRRLKADIAVDHSCAISRLCQMVPQGIVSDPLRTSDQWLGGPHAETVGLSAQVAWHLRDFAGQKSGQDQVQGDSRP